LISSSSSSSEDDHPVTQFSQMRSLSSSALLPHTSQKSIGDRAFASSNPSNHKKKIQQTKRRDHQKK
jgi:hypothetical protein